MLRVHLPSQASAYKTHLLNPDNPLALGLWLAKLDLDERLFVLVCQEQAHVEQMRHHLAFFGVQARVFDDWETLPYDRLTVSDEITSNRLGLLGNMPTAGVLLVSVATLMQRVAPPSWLLGAHFSLKVGERFIIDHERDRLIRAGYRLVDTVHAPGEFAVRGGIVDIFVMGQAQPLRLELFDDEIESIRWFDTDSQRTLGSSKNLEQFCVLPAYEFPLHDKHTFRQNFAHHFADSNTKNIALYQAVMDGIAEGGIGYYQPLFFDEALWQTGTLFHYLPNNSCIIYDDRLEKKHAALWQTIQTRYDNYRFDKDHPLLTPSLLYLPSNALFAHLAQFSQAVLHHNHKHAIPLFSEALTPLPNPSVTHPTVNPLQMLTKLPADVPTLLVAESAGRREVMLDLLQEVPITARNFGSFDEFFIQKDTLQHQIGLSVAPIDGGFLLDGVCCVISEAFLFDRKVIQKQTKPSTKHPNALVKSLAELSVGGLVVHIEHGIGRYQGLIHLDVGDGEQAFIHLLYADDASVYVPITHLQLIGRYSGTDTQAVALSKIGSGRWDKARQKTLTQIYDVAAELLDVQARRHAKEGVAFKLDKVAYELFAGGFLFDETDDQKHAIDAVLSDMTQNKPMDRLICGDVGFGKTEVAMRAAFVAVHAGYQVAVLVPTTLLAKQHEDSFKDRFADWPVVIESLSRFGSKKNTKAVLDNLAKGNVDIIIGTHKLLEDDVVFANLGLMIIDEEHRFGVRHKERIKAMQSTIDSLSMTATPIPRTLNMALSGMQDICIIATPPARRLAIKTFVVEKNTQTTTDAILRELLRGGQVYYLHNDVSSIAAAAEQLTKLVPEAKVGVAHGQMKEQELSAVMGDFYHKRFNVLVASTIIETGIDIPNANTIIINRADKFGLAQLHQLRGRVGRSHHQAYCYLFVPSIKGLSADAKKRLDAISRANTLGAGFMLASEDLEIRGAGELLGKEQSGNMQTIGFGLYMDMLKRATRAIKQGQTPKLDSPLDLISDINLHTSALIPDDYLPDVQERVIFYKRIAATDTLDELVAIGKEMIDRFGVMPVVLGHLFLVHELRLLAHPLGISKVDISDSSMTLEFRPDTPIDGGVMVTLLQSEPNYQMMGATALRYRFSQPKTEVIARFDTAKSLLEYFAGTLKS